jgi:hypothetical protein
MGAGMPSRWLRFVIVLFWLTTTGWLFWHDLWPKWRPGEPPSFHIDDVEEVQHADRVPSRIFWTVQRQKEGQNRFYPVFQASTWVEGQEEDVYTLNTDMKAARDPSSQPVEVAKLFKVEGITSSYRVNRAGQLRGLEAAVTVRPDWDKSSWLSKIFQPSSPPARNNFLAERIRLRIWGEVRDHRFFAHCSAARLSGNGEFLDKPIQFNLPAADVSYTGSVLMPLHPVSRIRGLRLGQSWRQPLVDPLRDAFASLPGFSGGVRWLNACVLPRPQMLEQDGSSTSCLVIEYTNDENEVMGRTWVEQDGERVLQQEAILEDDRWILKRDQPRRRRLPSVDAQHD